jgi:hypothetical protein
VESEGGRCLFMMAKMLTPAPDDEQVMKFVLMRLTFFEKEGGQKRRGRRGGALIMLPNRMEGASNKLAKSA